MLLTDSNPLFKLGMRPRSVTTPVRVRSQSGTWDETSTHAENLSPNPRPTPTQTATKNAHYFSTVHIPRLRECALFFLVRSFVTNAQADPARRVAFSARRTNTEVTAAVKAPPSIRSRTWRQARKSASRPLVHGLASALSAGIKSEQLENPGAGVDQGVRTLGPEVDLAGQRPQKSARPSPRPESSLAHARGRAGHNVPPAHTETCPTSYRVSIALPRPGGTQFSSEMITVSARRGGRLAVVADAWHLEHDCSFPFFAFCSLWQTHPWFDLYTCRPF